MFWGLWVSFDEGVECDAGFIFFVELCEGDGEFEEAIWSFVSFWVGFEGYGELLSGFFVKFFCE